MNEDEIYLAMNFISMLCQFGLLCKFTETLNAKISF